MLSFHDIHQWEPFLEVLHTPNIPDSVCKMIHSLMEK
jgi:hypothetical protein